MDQTFYVCGSKSNKDAIVLVQGGDLAGTYSLSDMIERIVFLSRVWEPYIAQAVHYRDPKDETDTLSDRLFTPLKEGVRAKLSEMREVQQKKGS